jgi:hypothetical protein
MHLPQGRGQVGSQPAASRGLVPSTMTGMLQVSCCHSLHAQPTAKSPLASHCLSAALHAA